MAAMNISCHSVERVSAVVNESGESRWIDLSFHNYWGVGKITIFLAQGDDPKFAALAEFIAATWPEDKPVEAAPAADEADLPF